MVARRETDRVHPRAGAGREAALVLEQEPEPWSIWVADVATAGAHLVWQSPNTLHGSFPETAGSANLAWGAGNVLIFLADLDGWPHLYSVPAAGGTPTLLTAGNFFVEHVAVSRDGKFIVYSANTGGDAADDDRRHIFRLATDRSQLDAITRGYGVEWTPVITGDMTATAFISATAQRPPVPAVLHLRLRAGAAAHGRTTASRRDSPASSSSRRRR